MGIGLISQGIMSGCYHICPNDRNYQFDTAFMYTISLLILAEIYQSRHPDINVNAHTAFGLIAFVIFIGVIGVLYSSSYIWMLFLFHVVFFVFSLKVYYLGLWRLDSGIFKRIWLVRYKIQILFQPNIVDCNHFILVLE